MLRSFDDRLFAGVCGGLAAGLRASAWAVRFVFVGLTIASGGAFAIAYLLLWWLVPQASLMLRQRGLAWPLALFVIFLVIAGWAARDVGLLRLANGADGFWGGAAVVIAVVFLLRQFGGKTAS